MTSSDTDILVVGAGPSGLTMAGLLAKAGVNAITITKYASTAHSPRAHITNQRAMEVYRALGIEDDVIAVATPNDYMRNNVWATSFAGTEIARLETWGAGVERSSDYEKASPSRMWNIPQHRLEPVLRETAEARGADIRFNTELISITQDASGVTAVVRDRLTGEESQLRARYAVGADGGRSRVAEQIGFEFDGESGLGAALNIWLEADLSKYCEYRPGTLYWMAQPGNDYWVGSGTWINVTPFTEWVLLCMYDLAEGEPDTSEAALIERARLTIGDPEVEVRIKDVSKWQINHMVARNYQSGRVFLVGDAAHRHPPANGLGTNTSVQDSYNLAWKLAAVIRGDASPELLETYSAERQPVGKRVVDRAMKSVQDMGPISQALGFSPGQSAEDGWRSLEHLFSAGEDAQQRRRALREAITLQNYQFNAHGMDMGERYAAGAFIDDGRHAEPSSRDADLYFTASSAPGSPIPHAWLEKDRTRLSTLDVIADDRFTLVTGLDDAAWRAGLEAARARGADIAHVQIGIGGEHLDIFGDWTELREVGDAGALLVRPDRVVAARFAEAPADAGDVITAALAEVLSIREPARAA